MAMFFSAFFLPLVFATSASGTSCNANANNEFVFRVNYHTASVTGSFEVDGCVGSNPVLKMQRGVTYTLVQHDVTNWMHPLGFAYYPDGAHGHGIHSEVPELEHPTPPECDLPDFNCHPGVGIAQAPLYGIDGVFESFDDWNNGVTGGLDVYEPGFQVPEDQWKERKYAVQLTIPKISKTSEFFYFCHIHSGMSGLIRVIDPAPDANTLVQPFDPSAYYPTSHQFDEMCGTAGVAAYRNNTAYCPGQQFLCGRRQNRPFARCMNAIDCQMSYEMSVREDKNPLVVFMHQMIPHHLNAVNMARIALKHSTHAPGFHDDSELDVPALMRGIINTQNHQIQQMRRWLRTWGGEPAFCGPEGKHSGNQ